MSERDERLKNRIALRFSSLRHPKVDFKTSEENVQKFLQNRPKSRNFENLWPQKAPSPQLIENDSRQRVLEIRIPRGVRSKAEGPNFSNIFIAVSLRRNFDRSTSCKYCSFHNFDHITSWFYIRVYKPACMQQA